MCFMFLIGTIFITENTKRIFIKLYDPHRKYSSNILILVLSLSNPCRYQLLYHREPLNPFYEMCYYIFSDKLWYAIIVYSTILHMIII